jgi:hypothetical protein
LVAAGRPSPVALSAGYQLAFLIAAASVVAGTVAAVLLLRGPDDRSFVQPAPVGEGIGKADGEAAGEPMGESIAN